MAGRLSLVSPEQTLQATPTLSTCPDCSASRRALRVWIPEVPGLYFLGLQWLSKMNSSFLSGVGDDAAVLADHIAARRL